MGVNLRKLQRCVARAREKHQKILTIYTQKTMYKYTDGIGGRSGKVLQIWIEDDSKNKKRNTNDGLQNIGSTDDKNTERDRDSGVATEKSVRGCGGETRECSLF